MLESETKSYLSKANKAREKAQGFELAGNVLQTAGMLGSLINAIYQGSKGRTPVNLAPTALGLGQAVGGIGGTIQNNANKQLAQGMMGDSNLSPDMKTILSSQALIDPNSAYSSYVSLMNKSNNIWNILKDAQSADPAVAAKAKSMLQNYSQYAKPNYGPTTLLNPGNGNAGGNVGGKTGGIPEV